MLNKSNFTRPAATAADAKWTKHSTTYLNIVLKPSITGHLEESTKDAKFYIDCVIRNVFDTVESFKCFISDISLVSDNISLTLFC